MEVSKEVEFVFKFFIIEFDFCETCEERIYILLILEIVYRLF